MTERFVALVRGLNVATTRMKMADLVHLCEDLGLRDVTTYLQSGNVLFSSRGKPPQVATKLSTALSAALGKPMSALVLSGTELQRCVAENPFLDDPAWSTDQLHATLLAEPLTDAKLASLRQLPTGDDVWRAGPQVIYIACRGSYGKTKLSNSAIERKLGITATTRNWRTMRTLASAEAT